MPQKRIAWYANGECPRDRLIVIANGRDDIGAWEHRLPRATLRRWRRLVDRARRRTGRTLTISAGWNTDRPRWVQVIFRDRLGNWAATPGTSSHGMVFQGQQTAAIDAGNWSWVYGGDYNAWQDDIRAEGFTRLPDGYQQAGEEHHIIDWNPWDDEPEFGGSLVGGGQYDIDNPEEDDMFSDQDRANLQTSMVGSAQLIQRGPGGSIYFADELGADHLGDFHTPDIEGGEFLRATGQRFGQLQLSDRDFDIARAVAERRWARKLSEISNATAAKVATAILGAAPVIDPQLIRSAIADAIASADIDAEISETTMTAIANKVADVQHERLAG